ncbi:MAG: CocE/NonD family hydrolase, partial [Planctomycetota bacterium]
MEEDASLKPTRSYTKKEARIEMRDGVTLYTAIYSPTDAGPKQRYPILLHRTPYGCWPYGSDQRQPIMYNSRMVEQGYIFVYQDLRSRSMSDGAPEFD